MTYFDIKILQEFLSDKIVFLISEFCILMTFSYALYNHVRNRNSGITTQRGKKSRLSLYRFTAAFITIVLMEVIILMDWAEGYKVIIFLSNLIVILYLGLFNGWFRNQLIGIISKIENQKERS